MQKLCPNFQSSDQLEESVHREKKKKNRSNLRNKIQASIKRSFLNNVKFFSIFDKNRIIIRPGYFIRFRSAETNLEIRLIDATCLRKKWNRPFEIEQRATCHRGATKCNLRLDLTTFEG